MAAASPPLSPTSTHAPKWRARSSRTNNTYTRDQLEQHFGNPNEDTLTGSIDDPQRISRILISDIQQPSFPPEIFIKSNLHLVFGTSLKTLQAVPIPLFRQVQWDPTLPSTPGGTQKAIWEFAGWYSIENAQRIERRSPELFTRLEAKWEAKGWRGQRTQEEWNHSFDTDWALITLRHVTDRGCPLEQPSPPTKSVADDDNGGGVGIPPGGFGRRAFSIDDGAPEDYFPGPPPPTRRTTSAGLATSMGSQVEGYFMPPPPPPPTRVATTLGTHGSNATTNTGGEGSGLDCKLMDESIINISKQSEEDMSDSEYGNVTRSELEDCDRWSELSTGPVDRQWTVVYEDQKDELV